MAKKRVKRTHSTLLIVGEGAHERAFLHHLKDLYDTRTSGQKIKIDTADGGSPADIIDYTIRKYQNVSFERKYILMDADIEIPSSVRKKAKMSNIVLILSEPICLDCMLLEILKQSTGHDCKSCKNRLHSMLAGEPTDKNSYKRLFPKEFIDQCLKEQIVLLRQLMKNEHPK
jgi:hypothetical protein